MANIFCVLFIGPERSIDCEKNIILLKNEITVINHFRIFLVNFFRYPTSRLTVSSSLVSNTYH